MAEEGTVDGRVLVVDDDRMVRSFIRHALARDRLAVEEADDGHAALERIQNGAKLDVVLLDGLLPDMHGVSLAQRVLEQPSARLLPICFLTGAVRHHIEPGAGFSCLPKPFRPTDLVREVRVLLAWAREGGSPLEDRRAVLDDLVGGFLLRP
jgi:CheY-like chemotaxis protein